MMYVQCVSCLSCLVFILCVLYHLTLFVRIPDIIPIPIHPKVLLVWNFTLYLKFKVQIDVWSGITKTIKTVRLSALLKLHSNFCKFFTRVFSHAHN